MTYIDIFNQRNAAYGNSNKDRMTNATKNIINSKFKDFPDYKQVTINGVPTDVRVVREQEYNKRSILTPPDNVLIAGSYLVLDGQTWMLMDFFHNDIYPKSSAQLCNSSLKWLDENGSIKEAFFTYQDRSSRSLGMNNGTVMYLPNEQRFLYVQNNTDTAKIEKGKRFIFDNRSWRVTSIDRLLNGIIYFELEEHDINTATDNLILRIADYVGNIPSYTLKVLNGDILSVNAGQTVQLNVEVKNNGIVNTSKTMTYTSSNTSIATVSSTGLVTTIANGHVNILVALADDPTVNHTVNIDVQLVVNPNVFVNIIGDDFLYCNTSKTYNEQVKNNGVVDNTKFVQWYLYDDTGSAPTTLASLTFQSTTQCTVTANNKGSKGYVRLKAVVIGNTSVIDVKRIKIKTLI